MTRLLKENGKDAVRNAVRFPIRMPLHGKTEEGLFEATTRNVSANGLLFFSPDLPKIGSRIEFTMDMPSAVMGWDNDVSIHCMGRVVRHYRQGEESLAAAVIDEYFLKA